MANPEIAGIVTFVSSYGYILIFMATLLENSMFVGLFVPGVVILLAGGFLASQGELNLFAIMGIAFAGGIVGDNLGYWIGRKGGRPILEKYRKFLKMTPERLKEVDDYYRLHGGKTVFLARFTAVLHALAPLLAGVSRMRYRKFVLFNAMAGIIWSVSVPVLGFFFGESMHIVKSWIGRAYIILFVLFVVGLFIYLRKKRGSKTFSSGK